MRNVGNKKAKLNNAGMTLVEILVAIAILSVAIIPLMFAFVNSMRYNARGRELQQTTALAHTIIENCKADTFDEVKSDITGGTFLTGGYTAYESGNTFYMQNVTLENQKYDVALTFNSHAIDGDTSYDILRSITMNPYMDAMLTVHTPMDPTDTDSITPATMDSHAYLMALEAISAGIKTASQSNSVLSAAGIEVDLSTSFIEDTFKTGGTHAGRFTLKRNMAIYITQDVSGYDTVKVMYAYSYDVSGGDYTYQYTDTALGIDETLSFAANNIALGTYAYDIYSNSDTKAKGAALENIYIMYYPAYSKTNAAAMYPFDVVEEINIYNELPDTPEGNDREVNLYLVKQKNSNYTDTELAVMDIDYAYKVQVTGSSTTGAKTNLYHNIDYNLGLDSVISGWAPGLIWNGVVRKDSMITKESKTLMYDFVVQIYKSGAIDVSGGTPSIKADAQLILTMDGTDLDW